MSGNTSNKISNWFQNTLLGIVMAIIGIMVSFFPKVISTISFMVIGVVFLIIGVTDALASIKYKDNTSSWKSGLITGLAGILISAFFLLTYYMPSIQAKITTDISIIVISIWCLIKCVVTLIGALIGKIKRRDVLLPAFLTGIVGVLLFIFRSNWVQIKKYGGYALLILGIVLIFIGLYQRADKREKLEKQEREQEAASLIEKENRKSSKLLAKLNKKKNENNNSDDKEHSTENDINQESESPESPEEQNTEDSVND